MSDSSTASVAQFDSVYLALPELPVIDQSNPSKTAMTFSNFSIPGHVIKKVQVPLTLVKSEIIKSAYGKSIKVTVPEEFTTALKKHYLILENHYDTSKFPVDNDGNMFIKVGPDFILPVVDSFMATLNVGLWARADPTKKNGAVSGVFVNWK